jgi:hypothetical protein
VFLHSCAWKNVELCSICYLLPVPRKYGRRCLCSFASVNRSAATWTAAVTCLVCCFVCMPCIAVASCFSNALGLTCHAALVRRSQCCCHGKAASPLGCERMQHGMGACGGVPHCQFVLQPLYVGTAPVLLRDGVQACRFSCRVLLSEVNLTLC